MSTNISYSTALLKTVSSVTLYIDFITLIFGTIGGICNLITFTSRQMRQSSTVFYLLCATVFQLLSILFCVVNRLTSDRSTNSLFNQSSVFCKSRYYLTVTLPALASYFMFLAAFDRCLSTSDNATIRTWSQVKIAYRLAAGTIIVGFVISIHILIFYDIYHNMCQIIPGSIYTFVFTGYLIIFVIFLPNTLMLIFSLITVLNVRKSRQRVSAGIIVNNMPKRRQPQRLEFQLIKIIVVQVILSILLSLLRLGSYSYTIITSNASNKTVDEVTAITFAVTLGGSLYFFNFATCFYASILTNKFFRNTFYERILRLYRLCIRQLVQRGLCH